MTGYHGKVEGFIRTMKSALNKEQIVDCQYAGFQGRSLSCERKKCRERHITLFATYLTSGLGLRRDLPSSILVGRGTEPESLGG